MNSTTWTQATAALHERSLSPQTWPRSSGGGPDVGEPYLVTFLENILAFASRLRKASPLDFQGEASVRGSAQAKAKANILVADFQSLLNGPRQLITLNFPNHSFHPSIDAVMKALSDIVEMTDVDEHDLSTLKARLKQLQSTLRRKSFLGRVGRHKLQASLRQQMFRRHFQKLLVAHGHARLHRFEVSYVPSQHRGFTPGKDMYEVVRSDWAALLSCLPSIFGSHLHGFAWQLDYTAEQGYRYFVAMLLSHDLGGATPEADALRQRWRDVTGGTGEYHDGRSHHLRSCRYRTSASHPWQSRDDVDTQINETAFFMSLPDAIVGFAPKGPQKPYGVG